MRGVLVLTIAALAVGVFAAPIHEVGVDGPCAKFCEKTFSVHTSEHSADEVHACSQGCKLMTIVRLNTAGNGAQADVTKCTDACTVAFNENSALSGACSKACTDAPEAGKSGGVSVTLSSDDDAAFGAARAMLDKALSRMGGMFGFGAPSAPIESSPTVGLLGANEAAHRNPFAADFHPPPARHADDDVERMWRQMEQMHARMNAIIASAVNEFDEQAEHVRPVGDWLSFGEPQFMVEIDAGSGHHRKPLRVVDASTLDLAQHEPSPPTARRAWNDDVEGRHSAPRWLRCLERRARRLSFVARVLVCAALMLCVCALCTLCAQLCWRRRVYDGSSQRAAYLQALHAGNGSQASTLMKQAPPPDYYCNAAEGKLSVDGAPMHADTAAVHASPPPPYREPEKNQGDVKIAA